MKKQLIYMFLVCLSAIISCEQIENLDTGNDQLLVEKISLAIDAAIEKPAETRTSLEGDLTADEYMRTVWVPSDAIGVVAWRSNMESYQTVEEFVTNIAENAETATFEGLIASSSKYYALYPYSSSLNSIYNRFIFNLPETQNYVQDSFDPKAAPMVARAAQGEDFEFQNLCGLLALKMTGNELIKSITFIGKDENGNPMPVSGCAFVDMEYEDAPVISFGGESPYTTLPNTSVTLNCETPVQLSETATPFYFVLPPATYSSFVIMIYTADGEVMIQEGTKPLTILRSSVQPTAALQYAETVYVNLSETGHANSYIVSDAGMYSFDARTIGNGTFGLIEGAEFHTKDVEINPSKVEILWQDRDNVITAPALVNGQVRFYAMGSEGNALIAVKDDAGNILWSWHIWSTDQPVEQTYVNSTGEYVMLDRNIGAIRADRGTSEEDWKESVGLNYQWGRKDPFAYEKYTRTNSQLSLSETIENPTYFPAGNGRWTNEWSKYLWSTDHKTIYDPCPVGYRVAVPEVWRGFTTTGEPVDRTKNMNIAGAFDHGWYFYITDEESETAWYPTTSNIDYWANFGYSSTDGEYWSAYNDGGEWSRYLTFYYHSDLNCHLNVCNGSLSSVYGRQVRCMKDENATSVVMKIQPISEVTTTSAKVTAALVAYQGDITIERIGIVYGTSSSVTLDNGEVIDADVTSGEFTITLDNLESLKKYYVRAFAVATNGDTYYSDKTLSFITPSDDGITNLSAGGTANCYHIQYPGKYRFDATVRGNSSESVGEIASADVIWEYRDNDDGQQIISLANYVDGFVEFETNVDAEYGNALIAVRDANGTILWSWHIWLCNFDPDQTSHKYESGNTLMDRNLGATFATFNSTEEKRCASGTLYQWGRKDPMTQGTITNTRGRYATYAESFANPTEFIWDSWWASDVTDNLWSPGQKTTYDPCPPGWRVASKASLENVISRSTDNNLGIMIEYDNVGNSAWYPFGYYYTSTFNYFDNPNHSYLWTSNYVGGSNCGLTFYYSSGYCSFDSGRYQTDAYSVRCMKEEN